MSHWICCNSCFKCPAPDRQLAVTNCGHIICSVCFLKGKEGECLICKEKCQLSPLSDKSSSEVKALFLDINTVAARYLSEISKVLQFQARHQKRILTYYQQKNEKMKETVIKMQQEMQQMSRKITEQSAYISKLEVTLQHQSSRLGSQSNRDVHASANFKPVSSVTKNPYSSQVSLPHHSSTTSHISIKNGGCLQRFRPPHYRAFCSRATITTILCYKTERIENINVDSRGFSRKPEISGSMPRLCLISPPQDGRIGTVPLRATSQSPMAGHAVQGASVRREFSSSLKQPMQSSSSRALYRRESPWESPVFKLAPAFKYPSMSSLGPPP